MAQHGVCHAPSDSRDKLIVSFFIPCAGCILIYSQVGDPFGRLMWSLIAQVMTVLAPRWVYLAAVVIFEAGSMICVSDTYTELRFVADA